MNSSNLVPTLSLFDFICLAHEIFALIYVPNDTKLTKSCCRLKRRNGTSELQLFYS